MTTFDYIYWAFAFVASVLLGWKAIEIFTDVPKRKKEEQPPASWWWQQRWFNFLGSLIGWFTAWILVRRYSACIHGATITPTASDLLIGFIAFVGVTGYLPFTVYGLISSVYRVGEKLTGMLMDMVPKE
jgi:hypothetical protein